MLKTTQPARDFLFGGSSSYSLKIGFVSLGCPKNLVDSEVMMGLSQEGGHTLTSDPADADVLVVNTCAFIDKAKEESVNTILELAEFKKHGNCKRLVVTGCLGERYRDELKLQIPESPMRPHVCRHHRISKQEFRQSSNAMASGNAAQISTVKIQLWVVNHFTSCNAK